jgi:choice-of-anchor A domain-containing protein
LNRFTAIIFGDFYTGGSQDILGALAVEGDFHAPNYVVNTNGGPECDDEDSLYYYGLIVGGITDTINTQVHGSAYLGGGGTIENVVTLEEGCIVTEDEAYDVFDFDDTKAFLIQTSSDFAGLDATLLLGSDHSLTNLRECGEDSYEVITFSSCGELGYSATTEFESYASSIFFGEGNWNGVQGSITIDRSKTYILNVMKRKIWTTADQR